jgi:hypothetical protein
MCSRSTTCPLSIRGADERQCVAETYLYAVDSKFIPLPRPFAVRETYRDCATRPSSCSKPVLCWRKPSLPTFRMITPTGPAVGGVGVGRPAEEVA